MNIEDYIHTKTVVHCPTVEDFDKITELCTKAGLPWDVSSITNVRRQAFETHGSDLCLTLNNNSLFYSEIKHYVKKEYRIIHASEFTTRNYLPWIYTGE